MEDSTKAILDLLKDIRARLDEIADAKKREAIAYKTVLDIDEAAFYMRMSASQLYKLVAEKKIPCTKPNGKKVYFDKGALDNWRTAKQNIDALMGRN